MKHNKNLEKLVSVEWLASLLYGELAKTIGGAGYQIIEVGTGAPVKDGSGCIPGAVYLDTNRIEHPPLWNFIPDAELERILPAHGITHDTRVILYSRNFIATTRVALLLMYAGVRDVHVLDGGLGAWIAAGNPVVPDLSPQNPKTSFGRGIPMNPEYIFDTAQVKSMLEDAISLLVCVRTWAEYTGQTSGYDIIQAKGRIPDSVWAGLSGDNTQDMSDYFNSDGTFRALDQIAAAWVNLGISSDLEKQITFYCGTGWRASLAFFAAYLMDWQPISVYDGGWLEWGNKISWEEGTSPASNS